MLILMKNGHTPDQLEQVQAKVKSMGFTPHVIPGDHSVAVGITGNTSPLDPQEFLGIPGVGEAIRVTKSYKLASRDFKKGDTEIKIGNVTFGGNRCVIIGGPCAVESEDQTMRIARECKRLGAQVLRGGAYKPRTGPYSFQGMGVEGLKILEQAKKETGLPIITEALDPKSLEQVYKYADIIQLGARNMQNFSLLQEVGKLDKPVLLKRGMSATMDEWLSAAEYILEGGNRQVMLCERGLRSFDPHSRNMLDITAIPIMRGLTHLPVVMDPSHGTGRRDLVIPMALAGLGAGAHAVMVDVHDRPKQALCDGPQALLPNEFEAMVQKLKKVGEALGVSVG